MGTAVIGQLAAIMRMESGQFVSDVGQARRAARSVGEDMTRTGGLADLMGTNITKGLGKGVKTFNYLGDQIGLVHSGFGKLATVATNLAFTGFNPVALAVAGISFAIGHFTDKAQEDLGKKVPEAVKESQREFEALGKRIVDLREKLAGMDYGGNAAKLATQRKAIEEAESAVRDEERQRDVNHLVAERRRLYDNVNQLRRAGYKDDDDGLRRQLELVRVNQQQLDDASRALGPLREKLEALKEELLVLTKVDEKERLSAERARKVEENQKSSEAARKAADAAKAAEIKRRADAWDDELSRRKEVVAGMVADAERISANEKRRLAGTKAQTYAEMELADVQRRAAKLANESSEDALLARRAVVEDRAKHYDIAESAMTESAATGFNARLAQIREEDAAWTTFGTNLANIATTDLSGGMVGALDQIRLGSKTAGAAFRDFATDTMFQVARLAAQMAILRALMSAVGVIAGGVSGGNPAGLSAAGNASQVSQSVGPGGVPNIELKSARASDVSVHLTVRPPAVIADDVAAKASPEAKAALVASAIARPGRRGMRARG